MICQITDTLSTFVGLGPVHFSSIYQTFTTVNIFLYPWINVCANGADDWNLEINVILLIRAVSVCILLILSRDRVAAYVTSRAGGLIAAIGRWACLPPHPKFTRVIYIAVSPSIVVWYLRQLMDHWVAVTPRSLSLPAAAVDWRLQCLRAFNQMRFLHWSILRPFRRYYDRRANLIEFLHLCHGHDQWTSNVAVHFIQVWNIIHSSNT